MSTLIDSNATAGLALKPPRLRILFVAPYVPSAIRVRPFHLLKGLAERGHAITLVCAAEGQGDEGNLAELRPYCTRLIAVPRRRLGPLCNYLLALPGPLPLQAAHSLDGALVDAVAAELATRSYDVVHIEHLRASQLALAARAQVGGAPALVLDSVDCISLLFERALRYSPSLSTRLTALADLARTRRYEAAYAEAFDHVVVTSSEDRWALATLGPVGAAGAISVVPNGVDLAYFQPREMARDPATVIFSGKMSYHANAAAALFLVREIMPLVWRTRADVRVVLAGAAPGRAVRALGADPRVSVTGYLPDLRPPLARATLAVCPILYGVGVQNKALEAMAMGTPVVAARQRMGSLAALPGRDVLVAEDAPSFAAQIHTMLESPGLRRQLALAGRAYVEREHRWSTSAAMLEQVLARATPR